MNNIKAYPKKVFQRQAHTVDDGSHSTMLLAEEY